MWDRIIKYLKALFVMKVDEAEDPTVLLAQAQQEMKAAQLRNRELAIKAISNRNQLLMQKEQTEKTINNLSAKAELALKNGNRELALQLLREKQTLDGTLAIVTTSVAQADESIEVIKDRLKKEEELIRTRAAQTMAMKTQWHSAQIEKSINETLDGMTSVNTDAAFNRASDKVNSLVSEVSARKELASTGLSGQMAELDDQVAHSGAEKELEAMSQRLGLNSTPNTPSTTHYKSADEELDLLQAKLG